MKKQLTQGILAASLSIIAWSCNQSDPKPKGSYIDGVFVTTIGNFTANDGSLSFFRREDRSADIDAYSTANGSVLSGGIQGYAFLNGAGAITVDNSAAGQDKVEIVDANTMEKVASIGAPDIENPRKAVFASASKLYVSCWGANSDYSYSTGYIAVVNLETNKVIQRIAIPKGPENLVVSDGKLYVGTTSYTNGRDITVIDITTDQILKTISFNGTPTPIGKGFDGKFWVGTTTEIAKVDPVSYEKSTFAIGAGAGKSAENFALGSDLKTIYFGVSYFDANNKKHGEIYKFGVADTQVNISTPLIKRAFNGLGVDPKQGLIYAAVDPSPVQSGYAVRYRTDGNVIDSVKVGASPIGFVFR